MALNAYLICPDLGDAVAQMVICRHLGPGHIRLHDTPGTKGFSDERYSYIKPLIEIQPYCASVARYDENEGLEFTKDFTGFRGHWNHGRLICDKVAVCAGLNPADIDIETPWITVPPAEKHGKIVVVRSMRHQGFLHYFRLWQAKHQDCIFIGQREEYGAFCHNCNPWINRPNRPTIQFRETRDAVEAAQLIAGARLYVGNPTFLTWIALGLHHPNMLVECCEPDTEFIRAGVRNVKVPADNPTPREFAQL